MTWETVMEDLYRKTTGLFSSICRNNNPITLSSFIIYHLMLNKIITGGTGRTYPSGAAECVLGLM
jgi:hypothetical protein